MALKFYGATTPDPGEWRTWRQDGADKLEVLVRGLPPAEGRRIDAKCFGKKRQITYATKGVQQDLDTEAQAKANLEKACYCMLDTRGFEFEVAAEQDVARLTALLGGDMVKVGAVVRFDGRWTDALKEYVFAAFPSLEDFVGAEALKMRGADVQEAEAAEKN